MNVENREVWQIAAGDTDRSYWELCLRWGVVLFGPGYAGVWPDCAVRLRDDGETARKIDLIRKYHEDIQTGDLVVLRLGTRYVCGVGRVEGPVEWLDDFGDIDGWDIQLVRRVRWLWKPDNGKPKEFGVHALKWGGTVQKLARSGAVFEWLLETEEQDWGVPELPPSCVPGEPVPSLTLTEIAEYLFDKGTAAGAINDLTDNMLALSQIASWYKRTKRPSESETVTYLVVPLLRALGWTPQRMAVEWRKIDVALFDHLPREDESLSAVVEVKPLGSSCLSAKSQGAGYAQEPGRDDCRRLVVTDGIRYGVYAADDDGGFAEVPTAYMNLTRLVRSYPALECQGAPEALSLLATDWRQP